MKVYIKNMVCERCISAVRGAFERHHIPITDIQLGLVNTMEEVSRTNMHGLQLSLEALGFEIIDDRKSRMIEQVKATIIQLVHRSNGLEQLNLSDHIATALHLDYKYVSTLFSEMEGITIEKYFIRQKIERIKELLIYDELSVSEIADNLGYSSVAHLSNQFKQVTGLTPSRFRAVQGHRKPLDKV